jgi:hypothetical protein
MTAVQTARSQARRASHNTYLRWLTRVGFIGYGILHLAVAWLCLQILMGRGSADSGQTGAFRTVAAQPFGRFVLIVSVVGLIAMAIWQLLLAAFDHQQEQGWHRPAERLASLGRTIIYTALALTAWQVVRGTATTSARQQQDFTANLLHKPYGPALVIVIGLGVMALGAGMAVYGWKKIFVMRLLTEQMSPQVRKTSVGLGRFGYVAKGLAFLVVGVLVVVAGYTADPEKSGGLDTALKTMVHQSYGQLLLLFVAAGFAAFGVYCFFQSRYRKV